MSKTVDQYLRYKEAVGKPVNRAEAILRLGRDREESGRGFDDDAELQSEYQNLLRVTAPSILEEAGRGLSSGIDTAQATLAGAGALGLETLGVGEETPVLGGLKTSLLETAAENQEEAARNAPFIGRLEDIGRTGNTFRDTLAFVSGSLGEAAPSIAETVGAAALGGGIGGIAARQVVKEGAEKFIKSRVGGYLTKKQITGQIDDLVKDEVIDKAFANKLKGLARESGEDLAGLRRKASRAFLKDRSEQIPKRFLDPELIRSSAIRSIPKITAAGAAIGDSILQSSGQIYNELYANGVDPARRVIGSLTGGTVMGLLDSLVEVGLGKTIFRNVDKLLGETKTFQARPLDAQALGGAVDDVTGQAVRIPKLGEAVEGLPGPRGTVTPRADNIIDAELEDINPFRTNNLQQSVNVRGGTEKFVEGLVEKLRAGAAKIDSAISPDVRQLMANIGATAGISGFGEGATEAIQEIVQEITVAAADPEKEFDTETINSRLLNAFAKGGLAGAAMGGPSGALQFYANRKPKDKAILMSGVQPSSETGFDLGAGGAPQFQGTPRPPRPPKPQTPLLVSKVGFSDAFTRVANAQMAFQQFVKKAIDAASPEGRFQDILFNAGDNENIRAGLQMGYDAFKTDPIALQTYIAKLEQDGTPKKEDGFFKLIDEVKDAVNLAKALRYLDDPNVLDDNRIMFSSMFSRFESEPALLNRLISHVVDQGGSPFALLNELNDLNQQEIDQEREAAAQKEAEAKRAEEKATGKRIKDIRNKSIKERSDMEKAEREALKRVNLELEKDEAITTLAQRLVAGDKIKSSSEVVKAFETYLGKLKNRKEAIGLVNDLNEFLVNGEFTYDDVVDVIVGDVESGMLTEQDADTILTMFAARKSLEEVADDIKQEVAQGVAEAQPVPQEVPTEAPVEQPTVRKAATEEDILGKPPVPSETPAMTEQQAEKANLVVEDPIPSKPAGRGKRAVRTKLDPETEALFNNTLIPDEESYSMVDDGVTFRYLNPSILTQAENGELDLSKVFGDSSVGLFNPALDVGKNSRNKYIVLQNPKTKEIVILPVVGFELTKDKDRDNLSFKELFEKSLKIDVSKIAAMKVLADPERFVELFEQATGKQLKGVDSVGAKALAYFRAISDPDGKGEFDKVSKKSKSIKVDKDVQTRARLYLYKDFLVTNQTARDSLTASLQRFTEGTPVPTSLVPVLYKGAASLKSNKNLFSYVSENDTALRNFEVVGALLDPREDMVKISNINGEVMEVPTENAFRGVLGKDYFEGIFPEDMRERPKFAKTDLVSKVSTDKLENVIADDTAQDPREFEEKEAEEVAELEGVPSEYAGKLRRLIRKAYRKGNSDLSVFQMFAITDVIKIAKELGDPGYPDPSIRDLLGQLVIEKATALGVPLETLQDEESFGRLSNAIYRDLTSEDRKMQEEDRELNEKAINPEFHDSSEQSADYRFQEKRPSRTEVEEDTDAREAQTKEPYVGQQTGVGVEEIVKGLSAKGVEMRPDTINFISEIMNFLGPTLFDDVSLLIREGIDGGKFGYVSRLVTLGLETVRDPENGAYTLIHELWHSLENRLPEKFVARLREDFRAAREKFDKETGLGWVLKRDDMVISKEEWDSLDAFQQDYFSEQEDGSFVFEFDEDTYRLKDISEWFAENMTKRTIARYKAEAQETKSVIAHLRRVARAIFRAINNALGLDVYDQILDAYRSKALAEPGANPASLSGRSSANLIIGEQGASKIGALGKLTNFYNTLDGLLRYKIDDSFSRIDTDLLGEARELGDSTFALGDLLDHPQLYKAYPAMQDIQVRVVNVKSTTRGSFARGVADDALKTILALSTGEETPAESREFSLAVTGAPLIKLNIGGRTASQIQATLLHEIQHTLQFVEGFVNGGNSDAILQIIPMKVKELTELHANIARGIREGVYGDEDFVVRKGEEINQIFEKGILSAQAYNKIPMYDSSGKKMTLEKAVADKGANFSKDDKNNMEMLAYLLYEMTAGEAEARSVEFDFNQSLGKVLGDMTFPLFDKEGIGVDASLFGKVDMEGVSPVTESKEQEAFLNYRRRAQANQRRISNRELSKSKIELDTNVSYRHWLQGKITDTLRDLVANNATVAQLITEKRLDVTQLSLSEIFSKIGLTNFKDDVDSVNKFVDSVAIPTGVALDRFVDINSLPEDSKGRAQEEAYKAISRVLHKTERNLAKIKENLKLTGKEGSKLQDNLTKALSKQSVANTARTNQSLSDLERQKADKEYIRQQQTIDSLNKQIDKNNKKIATLNLKQSAQQALVDAMSVSREEMGRNLGVTRDVNLRSSIEIPSATITPALTSRNILEADRLAMASKETLKLTSDGLTKDQLEAKIIEIKRNLEAREAIGEEAKTQVYRDLKRVWEVLSDKSFNKDEQMRATDRFLSFIGFGSEAQKAKATGTRFGRTVESRINMFSGIEKSFEAPLKALGLRSEDHERALKKATKDRLTDPLFLELQSIAKKVFEQPITRDEQALLAQGNTSAVDNGRIDEVMDLLSETYNSINNTIDDIDAFRRSLLGFLQAQRDNSAFVNLQTRLAGLDVEDEGIASALGDPKSTVTRRALDVGYYTFSHSPDVGFIQMAKRIALKSGVGTFNEAAARLRAIAEDGVDGDGNSLTDIINAFRGVMDTNQQGTSSEETFLRALIDSSIHKIFSKTEDGETYSDIESIDAHNAWETSDKTLIGFLNELYEQTTTNRGDTTRAHFLAKNLSEIARIVNTSKKLDSEMNPVALDQQGGVSVGTRKILLNSRELVKWPDSGSSYFLFNQRQNGKIRNSLAASIAFGRNLDNLNGALSGLHKEVKDAADLYDSVRKVASAKLEYGERLHYSGRMLRRGKARGFVSQTEKDLHAEMLRKLQDDKLAANEQEALELLKNLFQKNRLRNIAVDIATNLTQHFSRVQGVSHLERWPLQSFQLVVRNTLQTLASSIQQFNELFSPIISYGPNKKAWELTAQNFRELFGGNGMAGVASELFLGRNIFGIDSIEERLRRFKGTGLNVDTYNTLGRIFFQATQQGDNPPNAIERNLDRIGRILDFEVGKSSGVRFKPLAPFTMVNEEMFNANIRTAMKHMLAIIEAGIDFYTNNPGNLSDPTYRINAADLNAEQAEALQATLDKLVGSGYLDVDAMVRKAVEAKNRGVAGADLISDEVITNLMGFVRDNITLEATLSNTPSAALRGPWGVAMTMYGFMFRRGRQIAGLRLDENDQLYKDSYALAMKRMALVTLSITAPAMFIGALRDEYYERILGKKRNVRALKDIFQGDASNVFFTGLEQLSATGALGFWGDVIDVANVAAGEGTNRGLSVDKRVFAVSMITNFYEASKNMLLLGELNYNRVVRPMIMSLGGNIALSKIQALNQASDVILGSGINAPLFRQEFETVKRINAQNHMRVAGRLAGLEVRTFSGASSLPTPMTGPMSDLERSIYGTSTRVFRERWMRAVNEALKEGKGKTRAEAEKWVADSLAARHPIKKVFRSASEAEIQKMLRVMNRSGRADATQAIIRYNRFLENVGAKPYWGTKPRKSEETNSSLIPRLF